MDELPPSMPLDLPTTLRCGIKAEAHQSAKTLMRVGLQSLVCWVAEPSAGHSQMAPCPYQLDAPSGQGTVLSMRMSYRWRHWGSDCMGSARIRHSSCQELKLQAALYALSMTRAQNAVAGLAYRCGVGGTGACCSPDGTCYCCCGHGHISVSHVLLQ